MAYRIVVDAGHGGQDPGAVNGNLKEKDFNLKAANYMYKRFNDLGIPVSITRNTDENLSRTDRLNRINNAFGNDPQVILLSNHINAGGGEGAEVAYALRSTDTLAKNVLNAIGDAGQKTRSYYQKRLPENPSKDYYYIMRETGNITPLLIEYGFIDNPKDVNKLENNLLDYVEAVVKAVAEYTGYTYVAPNGDNKDEYTVKRGDTLYSIAQKYGISVDDLRKINNLKSDVLQIGQKLKIPTREEKPTGNYVNYTVKPGDTLYKISKEFDTTIKDIIQINNLDSTILSVGQIIKVPSTIASPENIYYTVKKGDSLYKIAQKYGVSVDDIISKNNLSSTVLQIGDILIIPNPSQIPSGPEEDNGSNDNNIIKYKVQPQDTLYSIAQKYEISVDDLKKANNLNDNILQIGQELIIPSNQTDSTQNYINYTVIPGDTLYRLASIYNTTVDDIKRINNLTSNTLSIGQILKIPTNAYNLNENIITFDIDQ